MSTKGVSDKFNALEMSGRFGRGSRRASARKCLLMLDSWGLGSPAAVMDLMVLWIVAGYLPLSAWANWRMMAPRKASARVGISIAAWSPRVKQAEALVRQARRFECGFAVLLSMTLLHSSTSVARQGVVAPAVACLNGCMCSG